jgi:uncharacterized protein YtpQ (UPF0354 family)
MQSISSPFGPTLFKIIILFGLFFSTHMGKAQTLPTNEAEFTTVLFDELKKAFPEVEFHLIKNLEITGRKNGEEHHHYLDSIFREFEFDLAPLKDIVAGYVASCFDLYRKSDKIVLGNVVPVIKSMSFLEDSKKLNGGKISPYVHEIYNKQLVMVFAEDSEEELKFITTEKFAELNMSVDSLKKIAIKNLPLIVPEITGDKENGLYVFQCGGNYENSLMLLPDLFRASNIDIKGDLIISIPTRDLLLVTGSKDKESLKKLKAISASFYEKGDRPTSPYLFIWKKGKFLKH